MKKVALLATALAMVTTGSAFAADMPMKALKAPPPPAFDPWDIAFGGAIMSDYIFRGVTQSNHKPSVAAYFEPRYNVNKDLQLYVGVSAESISFANRAAAEVDIYGGIRPTFGAFAFDIGVWGYLYPGGSCADNVLNGRRSRRRRLPRQHHDHLPRRRQRHEEGRQLLRSLRQGELHHQRQLDGRRERVLLAELPELGRLGQLRLDRPPSTPRRAPSSALRGVGMYVSGEFGRQWLGTSDAFYGTGAGTFYANGIHYESYNTWNIGVGFTYKVFTLDLRYSDTDLNKGDCNAFTSAFNATGTTNVTAINPGGAGSNWCGSAGIAKLSFDLTAMTNLK